MTIVEVIKSKWSRGKQLGNALLVSQKTIRNCTQLDESGRPPPRHNTMCCLGFACLALGATPGQIRGKAMPSEIKEEQRDEVDLNGLVGDAWQDSDFSSVAAGINDDPFIGDDERMEKLRELGKANGFEFIFK